MDFNGKLEDIKKILIRELDPEKIILFGSRAKGTFREGSDIDLAVKTAKTPDPGGERRLKERIDELAGLYSVDIVFLDKVSPEFAGHILEHGRVIYEKN